MRTFLVSALALGAMTTAAAADPVKLTDSQMDRITGGVLDNNLISIPVAVVPQISVPVVVNPAVAIGVLAENIGALADADVGSGNFVDLDQLGVADLVP